MGIIVTTKCFLIADAVASSTTAFPKADFNDVAIWASTTLTIYLAFRALSYARNSALNQKKNEIREAVIGFWEKQYGCLDAVLKNVSAEDLRVIGQKSDPENKKFKQVRMAFYVLSIILFMGAMLVPHVPDNFLKSNASLIAHVFIIVFLLQFFALALTVFFTYYEYKYYKRLGQLRSKQGLQNMNNHVSLQLHAKDADLFGAEIRYEKNATVDCICDWRTVNAYAVWKFPVPKSAQFSVVVEQACAEGCGGNYAIIFDSGQLNATVKETASWDHFSREIVGHIQLKEGLEHTLKIEPTQVQGNGLMKLRAVSLHQIVS